MRDEYDFSGMEARKNPYAKALKSQVTISLDKDAVDYFWEQAASTGIPYQSLINLYLKDCANKQRKLELSWQ